MKKFFIVSVVSLMFILITGCNSNIIFQGSNSTDATATSKENAAITTDTTTQTDKTLTTDNVERTNKDNFSLNNIDEYSLIFDSRCLSRELSHKYFCH